MALGRTKPAKVVGRYQLAHELAASYLGPLWAVRVEGAEGGGQLAMLRLISLSRLDADTRVRLLEAAWQAMEVRDDRVCPVTDVVASDGELSVVSDYAEGLPLRALQGLASVRRKPLAIGVALRILTDLVDAVAALHRTMHELGDEAVPLYGGLSPDSILVGANGRTSVIDVAVASVASSVESFGGNPERVAYSAPEQVASPPRSDARSDVFAVGIVAWELFSGRRLFVGSDKAVGQKVLAAKIPRVDELRRKGDPEIPAALSALVTKALERDPDARFSSIDELASSLRESGVAVAEPAEVESYVATVAEGALSRTRDALKDPVSKVRAVTNPWSKLKPPEPAGAVTNLPVGEGNPPSEKPKPPSSPVLRRPITTAGPRPRQATMIGIPAPARLEAEAAARSVAELHALEKSEAAELAVPTATVIPTETAEHDVAVAPIEPIEPTEPVSGRFETIPPVPHALDVGVARAPMNSQDASEEPTGQYTARDLLKQVEEMARRSDRARRPPTDFPEPPSNPRDAELLSRPTAQFPPAIAPTFGTVEEDAWLDDPAPASASESEPQATPSDAFLDDEPLTNPPLADAPSPIRAEKTFVAPPTEPTPSVRPQERKLFSKLPPAASGPGFIPSQMPPPLIHDPRARHGSSARAKKTETRAAPPFARGVLLGVMVSFGLVVASATIAIVALRGRDKEAPVVVAPANAPGTDAPTAPPPAPVAAPAPNNSVAPALAESPPQPVDPAAASAASAAPTPTAPVETALVATPTTPLPRVVSRAAASAPPRPSTKKKRGRFVPDDI